jgi:ABC-type branched-subunit amino acid transport system permease subunit
MVLQDYISKLKLTVWGLAVDGPQYWQFGVGLLLVLTVLFARRGLLGLLEDSARLVMRGRRP